MFSGFNIWYLLIIISLYIHIAYVDYKTRYIYDWTILTSVVVNLGYGLYSQRFMDCVAGGVLAGTLHGSIYLITKYIYHEEKYGLGDVLLMLSVGTMLGAKAFWEYQFLEITVTGILSLPIILFKGRDFSVSMAPIYVLWLLVYLGMGKPDFFEWYCSTISRMFLE